MNPSQIRAQLEFSVEEFSQLLGVSASTAYRWEQVSLSSRIDPFQRKILGLLEDLVTDDVDIDNTVLAAQIRRGLLMRGTLGGLYVVLAKAYEGKVYEKQETQG